MNVTITLVMYWSIAIVLAGGGIYSLKKGFELILSGKGKAKEENSIEIFGLKASLSSIGSLVMITAFMWAWAAKLTLPNYKDANVEITALMKNLEESQKLNIAQKKELNAMRKVQDSLIANIEEPEKDVR